MNRTTHSMVSRRLVAAVSVATLATLGFAGCSSGGATDGASDGGGSDEIGVSLIVKTTSNPFFIAM